MGLLCQNIHILPKYQGNLLAFLYPKTRPENSQPENSVDEKSLFL